MPSRSRAGVPILPVRTYNKGFESILGFTLDGFLPLLTITAEDHEGGGWVQIFQVKVRLSYLFLNGCMAIVTSSWIWLGTMIQ